VDCNDRRGSWGESRLYASVEEDFDQIKNISDYKHTILIWYWTFRLALFIQEVQWLSEVLVSKQIPPYLDMPRPFLPRLRTSIHHFKIHGKRTFKFVLVQSRDLVVLKPGEDDDF